MNNNEALDNNSRESWDMSNIPFAGDEKQEKKESIKKALRYSNDLLINSGIFGSGNGGRSGFTDTILNGSSNREILANITQLDNGRYKENYGVDYDGRGYTGLGQVSGALDYFDAKYDELIDNVKVKGFIKTCISMWPMGSTDNFGVRDFARTAKMDDGTASLVNMMINRNSIKLASARFNNNDEAAGEELRNINEEYITKLHGDGFSSGYERKEATCACNMQKILIECEKEGARIAKERRSQK